jgi:hypothetical protein|tara:strand:- start:418 stop:747 length:330 start_codon:yes stop_codon:yes gene_type:complete
MKQSYQTEFEKLSWKEICMRVLRCFGEANNDWHHKDWHEYGIDRKHGKIIVEQYEQWMDDNGIKTANLKKNSSNMNIKESNINQKTSNMNAKESNINQEPSKDKKNKIL